MLFFRRTPMFRGIALQLPDHVRLDVSDDELSHKPCIVTDASKAVQQLVAQIPHPTVGGEDELDQEYYADQFPAISI